MPHNQVLPTQVRDRTVRSTASSQAEGRLRRATGTAATGIRKRRRGLTTAISAGADAPTDLVTITADRRKKRRSILQGLLGRPFATNIGGQGGPGAKKKNK